MNKSNASLAMLTIAASQLINTTTEAAVVAEKNKLSYRHHNYQENKSKDFSGEERERYDISVNQFSLVAPISDSYELSVDYQYEKMSGASPWYTFMLDNEPVQVLSGASIFDRRKDIGVGTRYVHDDGSFAVNVAKSTEDDYKSKSIGFTYEHESDDKLSTYAISADYSSDKVNPVDADLYPTRPSSEQSKKSNSFLVSYSQVLSVNSIIQYSVGLSRKSGYLSDPYKLVLADFQLLGDTRPGKRIARTFSSRYRYFSNELDAALHLDYRFYHDSWHVSSHTIELSWYQNVAYGIQVIPSIRAYSQSSAYFYESAYSEARSDGFYSTDYRLSEYGAYTYGLQINKAFGDWLVTASIEKYNSDAQAVFADAHRSNPGLVDFKVVSIGLDYSF